MLQVGGAQRAEMSAPPWLVRAVAELVPEELVREEKDTTSGSELIQVKGGLVKVNPRESTTVACNKTELPLVTLTELAVVPEA